MNPAQERPATTAGVRRTLAQLLDWIGGSASIEGRPDNTFERIDSLFDAAPGSLTWARADLKGKEELINNTAADVIICDRDVSLTNATLRAKTVIRVDRPEIAFLRALKGFHPAPPRVAGVHPSAVVDPAASIAADASIGPFAIIGRCQIGRGSSVGPYTMVHDGTEIGANVIIREHCSIGGEGLGHILNERNELENFPHVGRVIIEDDVEIFPFVNVDRATLDRTIIERGARIDHHVHVAHNVRVESHAMVVAHTVLCGGCQVGSYAYVGAAATIRDRLRVGERALVGMAAVVTKNIPAGEVWAGSPAAPLTRR